MVVTGSPLAFIRRARAAFEWSRLWVDLLACPRTAGLPRRSLTFPAWLKLKLGKAGEHASHHAGPSALLQMEDG